MSNIIIIIASILAILFIAIAIYLVYKQQGLNSFRSLIAELIVQAENIYNYGDNSKKFNYVFDRVYELIVPTKLKIFITEDDVKKFIQSVFDEIKVALDYKKEV